MSGGLVMILNREKILELARAFIDEGKYDKAIREYEKILLADPNDLRVKLRIGELYTKRKQITEAIRIYREVAEAYAAEGFYLKAVTVYKNILRLNPSYTDINERLAMLYEKMGLTTDAVRQYDILATALDIKGPAERVIEIRSKIVKLNPTDGSARIRLAELYQREGKMEEAIGQYEEYAKQLEKPDADQKKLADLYEKILSYRPEKNEMLRKLISICMNLGDTRRALKWLDSCAEITERDPDLLALQANIYSSQNQSETARTKYMLLADLQAEKGNINAALNAYCQILVLLPDEEDRLARRVEDLKAGALIEIVERAKKQREEIEDEVRKEEEAERGNAPVHVPKRPKHEAHMTEEDLRADAQPKRPEVLEQLPQQKMEITQRQSADVAYDLGFVYQGMGLTDESYQELTRAKEIYEDCIAHGTKDADIPERIAKIETVLNAKVEPSVDLKGLVLEDSSRGKKHAIRTKPEKKPSLPNGAKSDSTTTGRKKKVSFF